MRIRQNGADYGYHALFERAEFQKPNEIHWPTYSWGWCDNVERGELVRQMDEFCEADIKNLYIIPHPREFRPAAGTRLDGYLQEKYLDDYDFVCRYALEKGLRIWLYDEGGWPSGSANGEVVREDTELVRRCYAERETDLAAGVPYAPSEDVITAYDHEMNRIAAGYTADSDTTVHEYYISSDTIAVRTYPNLMEPKSTKDFIRYTHERYREKMPDLVGSDFMRIAFTDEPNLAKVPWSADLEERFTARYGYALTDYLPAIVSGADMGEAGCRARIDYRDLCGELFAERYFRELQAWCRAHGMLSAGHINGEDETLGCINGGYMHCMRMLRCFDIPGIDTIWRQIFPQKPNPVGNRVESANLFFPRYASSSAYQTSSNSVLSESFAIYGAGLTFEQMRFVLNFQGIRGINLFNIMNQSYALYDCYMAGARPTFAHFFPGGKDKRVFHEYAARMSYLLSVGNPERKVALYMPIRDFWANCDAETIAAAFESVGRSLEACQVSFDVFDDDVMESCDEEALAHGVIRIGLAAYEELWFSPCSRIPDGVKEKLERFVRGGGKIYVVRGPYDPQIDGAEVVDSVQEYASPVVRCLRPNDGIRAMKRITDDGTILFITNEAFEHASNSASVSFDDIRPAYELDCLTGRICRAGRIEDGCTVFDLDLLAGDARVYLFTDRAISCDPAPWVFHEKFAEISEFSFRRVRSFVIGEERLESIELNEPAKIVAAGDWQVYAGKDFSGDAEYTASFAKPADAERIRIDLGVVNYTCELFINGKSHGVCCMSPYVYEIAADELDAENRLTLRVSNTSANQYIYTKSLDRFSTELLGRYHPVTLRFEKESLKSGLMNPITLWK